MSVKCRSIRTDIHSSKWKMAEGRKKTAGRIWLWQLLTHQHGVKLLQNHCKREFLNLLPCPWYPEGLSCSSDASMSLDLMTQLILLIFFFYWCLFFTKTSVCLFLSYRAWYSWNWICNFAVSVVVQIRRTSGRHPEVNYTAPQIRIHISQNVAVNGRLHPFFSCICFGKHLNSCTVCVQ